VSATTDKLELIAQYSQLPLNSKYMRLIAHDVRNQMNTIMMANDMLREELKDAEGNPEKYVTMISHASEDILIILDAAVAALSKRDEAKEQADS
jgi:signal transduction histidine kinase